MPAHAHRQSDAVPASVALACLLVIQRGAMKDKELRTGRGIIDDGALRPQESDAREACKGMLRCTVNLSVLLILILIRPLWQMRQALRLSGERFLSPLLSIRVLPSQIAGHTQPLTMLQAGCRSHL